MIRNLIRILVATALVAAFSTSVAAPVPEDLPALALGQPGIYRLEIALLIFYGGLLLITPTFSALISGRLPIEISTRGAKFAEDAGQSTELNQAAIEKLEKATSDLTQNLADVMVEVDELTKGK